MLPEFVLDREAAGYILRLARAQGKSGHEAAVILAGRTVSNDVILDRVVVPRQLAFRTEFGCGLVLDGGCLNRVGPRLRAIERRTYGILHSHPDDAYHSPTDDAAVLMRFHGAFSVVIPEFGARRHLLDGSMAFRFDYVNGWAEVAPSRLLEIREAGPYDVIHDD